MYIKAHVDPQSKKEQLETTDAIYFEIKVKEPARGNRANTRVIELLAEYFKVPIKTVRIVNGHKSPSKLISIDDTFV